MSETEVENGTCVNWQKRCLALETQLLQFRLQASKIRKLLADKMQDLEQRLLEAEHRAENAETQVGTMEKIKLVNVKSFEPEGNLHQKYQELLVTIRGREELITQLQAEVEKQKQLRVQDAKTVQEKAAKIKEWVTMKLGELEMENRHLKSYNQHLLGQVRALQEALGDLSMVLPGDLLWSFQGKSKKNSVVSDIAPHCEGQRGAVKNKPSGDSASLSQSALRAIVSLPSPGTQQDKHLIPEVANTLKGSGRVTCREIPEAKAPQLSPGGLQKSAYLGEILGGFQRGVPIKLRFPAKEGSLGSSMTLPKVRAFRNPRDSIQLAKRRYSQPQLRTGRLNHMVSIEISTLQTSQTHTLPMKETDIDQKKKKESEKMDTEEPPSHQKEVQGNEATSRLDKEEPEGPSAREVEIGNKPPTPPLHQFPSWESRIYAVASSGMQMSKVSPGNDASSYVSSSTSLTSPGSFSRLVYKNFHVPVYTTLKGRATQISTMPFLDESSGSDDDCSSQASVQTSITCIESRKASVPGSPRAIKRGVSISSLSSESDYAIPPDAYSLHSDYSEPEYKVQRTSIYSIDGLGSYGESLEKSGYLLKMDSRVKTWKRRWFVLRHRQIMYYKSPSDVIRKPQGQVELNSHCHIVRGEGAQTFQLISEKKTYYLTADSPNLLEEWIRVLQSLLKVQAIGSPALPQSGAKPTVRGWLTKVKHGHSKLVWCSLVGKTFYYYRSHEDKYPLGCLPVQGAFIEEVDRSCDSDEDYEATGGMRRLLSSHCTLVIHPPEHSPTYLLIGSKHEKDTWLYHLTVVAGSSSAKVGTAYEQLIGKLMDEEGDPGSPLWRHPMLCYSKDGLCASLTTLPSEALQTEALKLFKSCQLFINVPVEAASVDYHVSLAQTALQVCLVHPELQSELYCQLIKQISCHPRQRHSLLQCWQLLALCAPLFLPQHHFLWYIKQQLQRHADPRSESGQYATYCHRAVERTLEAGEREAKPSRMEVVSILLRNPYHHSLPFSIPVHFVNGTYQVVGFDGSSTVDELLHRLNQEMGMRKTPHSGFSLFTDDPSGKDLEHYLQGSVKICDAISKWEQSLRELHPGKSEGSNRIVKLIYKNRLYFRHQVKGETEQERLLLAFQVSNEITAGRFPVSKELALEMAALMAQVEYGDLEKPNLPAPVGTAPAKAQHLLQVVIDRFYPRRYRYGAPSEQLRHLADALASKWTTLQGCSSTECIRIYLTVARKWSLFGAKLFAAQTTQLSTKGNTLVWIAVNEDGVSILEHNTMQVQATHPYSLVMTFGGYQDDFMIVIKPVPDKSSGKGNIEKLIFRMALPKIAELTFMMASYMNHCSTVSSSSPNIPPIGHLQEMDGKQFLASASHSTKGPTLL
ncbi:pleckstrin homology domain-containing family H member 1 [Dromiciops gliroides]|uniref:pleckstrin homology domain-containing family H member 1 n=1 Tax=Dromiciops gliroides TaxID=33562 RepID=UPI001CC6A83F|nr:pleckstrin homology domain-containing family H member 1 [Dromiciops gliroides]XP_043844303.1 pleckstrin homology domain-containing family H member 1 [Dromiciops gliroides]XP_043844304.1 pleckstrin homology domain-containing family H member 1 [Dromiciops gliroides]